MTREEYESKLDELQKELEALKQAAIEEHVFPMKGKAYYTLFSDGSVQKYAWTGCESDIQRLSIGNVFQTEEDANIAIERLNILAGLSQFAETKEDSWQHGTHWCILCDMRTGEISFAHTNGTFARKEIQPYFATFDDAKRAVQTIGEDRIKKYLFGYTEEN